MNKKKEIEKYHEIMNNYVISSYYQGGYIGDMIDDRLEWEYEIMDHIFIIHPKNCDCELHDEPNQPSELVYLVYNWDSDYDGTSVSMRSYAKTDLHPDIIKLMNLEWKKTKVDFLEKFNLNF